jgi:hypothetical protein
MLICGGSFQAGAVKPARKGDQLDALLVDVGNHVGGVGDGAEEAIQFGHDRRRLAFLGGGE